MLNVLIEKFKRAYVIFKVLGFHKLIFISGKFLIWPILRYKDNVCIKIFEKHDFYLNSKDQGISKELYLYNIHEPITTELIKKEIKNGFNVIDIGANIGYYAILISHLIKPRGKIIAIEPFNESANLLRKNFLNNRNGVDVIVKEVAIDSVSGVKKLYIHEKANWNTLLPYEQTGNSIDVEVSRVDDLVEFENVSFVRMDIEGYEIEAIEGMKRIIEESKPLICMEIHPHLIEPERIKNMLLYLKDKGYEFKYCYPRKYDLIGLSQEVENYKYFNIDQFIKKNGELYRKIPYVVWME